MKTSLLAGLGLLLATSAQAGMLSVDGMPGFERLDANADGVISREEADGFRALVFDLLDGDRDGAISTAEVVAQQQLMQMRAELRQSRMALAAARLDADSDGAITREEFGALPDFFALADRNDDGQISLEEAADLRERLSRARN